VVTVGDIRFGDRLRIDLQLATGRMEVMGHVLDVMGDRTTRIRFEDVPDSDAQRLQRHPVDLQFAR
jgi:hypothetical protein